VVTCSPNPAIFGQDVLMKATVTAMGNPPSGTVVFRDGNAPLRPVMLVSGVASYMVSSLSAGPHAITGIYSGDSTHTGMVSAPVQQQIIPASSTVSVSSNLNPSVFGQSVTFTATVKSGQGVPSGTVTFFDGSNRLGRPALQNGAAVLMSGTLSAGTHQITATYNGDAGHASAVSPPFTQTVNKAPTTTVLTSAPNPSMFGEAVIFTATVSSNSGGTPNGRVTLLDGSAIVGRPVTISGGRAAFTSSTLTTGAHNVTASYAGNANFAASVSPVVVQTVAGLVTPTVVLTVSPSVSNDGDTVTFTATVSYPGGPVPTGSITISDVNDGAKIYGLARLDNGVAVVKNSTIPVGSYNLVATYGGDGGSHYNGAQSNSAPLRVLAVRGGLRLVRNIHPRSGY
jgi:large repetitive protein